MFVFDFFGPNRRAQKQFFEAGGKARHSDVKEGIKITKNSFSSRRLLTPSASGMSTIGSSGPPTVASVINLL